jgi:DNA-binding NarL/FixJ family response regulator
MGCDGFSTPIDIPRPEKTLVITMFEPSLKTVLIVDDHPLFAEVLAAILAADERVRVVGIAANGAEALSAANALRPDVVLMDLDMPVLGGIEATRRLLERDPSLCVVIVSASNSRVDVESARLAGALAFVPKNRVAFELLEAIQQACCLDSAAAA